MKLSNVISMGTVSVAPVDICLHCFHTVSASCGSGSFHLKGTFPALCLEMITVRDERQTPLGWSRREQNQTRA